MIEAGAQPKIETPFSGVFLGDFAQARTVLIAMVSRTAQAGAQLRALQTCVGEALAPDDLNYWLMGLLRFEGRVGRLVSPEVSFQGGFPAGLKEIVLPEPVLLSRGDVLAVRMSLRGAPPPITGLSVIPEWGILSSVVRPSTKSVRS